MKTRVTFVVCARGRSRPVPGRAARTIHRSTEFVTPPSASYPRCAAALTPGPPVSEMAKIIAQVPPVVESLTGLRMDQLVARLRREETDGEPGRPAAP
jgi:hypothetical protein